MARMFEIVFGAPEAAMYYDGQRVRTGTQRQAQIAELQRVRAIAQADVGGRRRHVKNFATHGFTRRRQGGGCRRAEQHKRSPPAVDSAPKRRRSLVEEESTHVVVGRHGSY